MHLQRTSSLTGERVRHWCERNHGENINAIFSASHRHAHFINVLFLRSVLWPRFTKRRFHDNFIIYRFQLNIQSDTGGSVQGAL